MAGLVRRRCIVTRYPLDWNGRRAVEQVLESRNALEIVSTRTIETLPGEQPATVLWLHVWAVRSDTV